MTALSRLRRRLGTPSGTVPGAFFDLETVKALLELADACEAESQAECACAATCVDDGRHVDGCPQVGAFQARLVALSTLRDLP